MNKKTISEMMNTNELSLEVAKRLTEIVNDAWANGSMLAADTPTTKELLKWWFSEEQCSIRKHCCPVKVRRF